LAEVIAVTRPSAHCYGFSCQQAVFSQKLHTTGTDLYRHPMSALVSRTIYIGDRRTSVRLHPAQWEALDEIAARQGKTLHDVLFAIDKQRDRTSLSTAIRVYIVKFFRDALQRSEVA
jgi:predicted DNA-binding ribbon-helix-helix protein